MEYSFSIVKSKMVYAKDCTYTDSAELQLRCPYCLEPVYLKDGEIITTHFSHYKESINAKDCEIRSKNYSASSNTSNHFTNKGQTLKNHYKAFSLCFAKFCNVSEYIIYNFIFSDFYGNIKKELVSEVKKNSQDIFTDWINQDSLSKFIELSTGIFLEMLMSNNIKHYSVPKYVDEFSSCIKYFNNLIDTKEINFEIEGKKYRENKKFYKLLCDENEKISESQKIDSYLKLIGYRDLEISLIKFFLSSKENEIIELPEDFQMGIYAYVLDGVYASVILKRNNQTYNICGEKVINILRILLLLGEEKFIFFSTKIHEKLFFIKKSECNDLSERLSLILNLKNNPDANKIYFTKYPLINNEKFFYLKSENLDEIEFFKEKNGKCNKCGSIKDVGIYYLSGYSKDNMYLLCKRCKRNY